MKYILTLVLFVFTLGVYAETLPASVTNDNDISYNSITNDCDLVSATDYVMTFDFEFYDNFDAGKSFALDERKTTIALIQTYLPVNDVGWQIEKESYILTFEVRTKTPLTHFVYRKSRDGLMCNFA